MESLRLRLGKFIGAVSAYLLPTGVVLLFLFFWIESRSVKLEQHLRYINDLGKIQELDARINQNVLETRLKLLLNYDSIVNKLTELRRIQADLQQIPSFINSDGQQKINQAIKTYLQVYRDKEKEIDLFKSQKAVVDNSLTYFPIAIAELKKNQTMNPVLADHLNTLLRDILLFNLSNNQELQRKIQQEIQQIRTDVGSTNQRKNVEQAMLQQGATQRVIAHAQILLERHPQINRLVDNISHLPTPDRAEDIAQAYYSAYQQALDTASLYRLGLYLLSTVIIIWIAVSIIYKLRQSAIALQQSESKLRTIFENSQVGIFRVRQKDSLVIDTNQRLVSMLGYDSAREIIGYKCISDLYAHPNQQQEIVKILQTHGEVHNFELQLERRDGTFFWGLFSARLNVTEHCVEGVITDISDRKRTEAALEQAKEAAVVANRAKSQFLSHMSHELRTPLSVILGFTQLLSRSSSLDPKQQEYLDTISRSGEHLLNLINDVLEMSKIEANKITLNDQDFNLYDLLDGLQQMFQFKATSKGLQFIVERSPDLPQYIRADESKLRQVLFNLVGNAVKFTQAGSVTLRVKLETRDCGLGIRKEISQSPIPNTQSLIFEVEDTGSGIASEELDQLFEPFVQTETGRKSQQGTGLGLSISRKFVQLMGGNITVESELGKGSCFRFNIQAQSIEADVIPLSATSQQVIRVAAGQPTYRIMVVEDKPSNRQLLVELLKPVGFEVREAENGIEAIALTQRWFPHLIWMDLQMPVMDGYEATKQIKSSESAPIIIALTGNAFEQEQQVALEAGCDDFVRKPYRAEVIFEKMTQYLGVSYVYAEQERTPQENENSPSSLILSPSSLEVMPSVWIKQMHQAATCVNAKLLHQLIDQIPGSHAPIANALTHLIDNFQFEDLIALTQQKSP